MTATNRGGRWVAAAVAVLASLAIASCDHIPSTPVDDTVTRTAFPIDSTTGPDVSGLDEENLPSCGHDGSWAITASGTYEGCEHNGIIRVQAPGVTLRNLTVNGNTNGGPIVRNESTGLVIERSVVRAAEQPWSVTGPSGEPCGASVAFGNYTARESEFTGCADGVKLAGTVEITDSFIHDLYKGCLGTSCTHNDGFQSNDQAGRIDTIHVTLLRNSVYLNACESNRIIQAPNLQGSTFEVHRNFFYGSHGILNVDKDLADTSNTGNVTENLLGGTLTSGPFSDNDAHTAASPGLYTGVGVTNIARTDNYFEDGNVVPVDGKMSPYSCSSYVPPTTTTTTTAP